MALVLGVTSGTKGTTAAPFDQTLNISGFPSTPKAAIYLYTRNNTAFDNVLAISGLSIGFTDGTNQYSCLARGRHARATTNTLRRQLTDEVIGISSVIGTGTMNAEANFKQFNTTGSDITWAVNDGTDRTVGAIYFTQNNSSYTMTADVGTFTLDSTQNNSINVTGLGSSADIVIVAGIDSASVDTGLVDMIHTIGIYVKGRGQYCVATYNQDAASTTTVRTILESDRVARAMGSGGTGVGAEISDHASGFSVTTRDSGTAMTCGYLAINVGQEFDSWIGEYSVPTVAGAATTNTNNSGVDITPKYLLSLICQLASADTEANNTEPASTYGFGAAASTTSTDQYSVGSKSEANQGTSDEQGFMANGLWTGVDPSDDGYQKGVVSDISLGSFDITWSGGTIDATGTSAAAAFGTSYVDLSAAFDGQGTFDAVINRRTPFPATEFAGEGSFGGSAVLRAWSDLDAAFDGQGTFSPGALSAWSDLSAAFDGQGTFDAVLNPKIGFSAAFDGQGTFDATLTYWAGLAAAFDGQGTFDATLTYWAGLAAAFDGQGTFDAILDVILSGGPVYKDLGLLSFDGQGTFDAVLSSWVNIAAAFDGEGTFNIGPLKAWSALQVLFEGQGTFDASFNKIHPFSALFEGQGTFDASFNKIHPFSAAFAGEGTFDAGTLTALQNLQAAFGGTGSFDAVLSAIWRFWIEFQGVGSFAVGDITGVAEVPASQYERIQRELITQAKAGTYYNLQYSSSTRQVDVLDTTTVPATVIAREKVSNFDFPKRYRQSFRYERKDWVWELILEFHDQVCVEFFEESLAANPIILSKTGTMGQVIMEFTDSEVFQPLQQQPRKGTRAVFNFIARTQPV